MLHLDRVVFINRRVKRKFPTMSTSTNEHIKKRIEDEDWSYNFWRGTIEPRMNVPHPTMPEQHPAEDIRSSKIQAISKTCLSMLQSVWETLVGDQYRSN